MKSPKPLSPQAAAQNLPDVRDVRPQDTPVVAVDCDLPGVASAAQSLEALRTVFARQAGAGPEALAPQRAGGADAGRHAVFDAAVLVAIVAHETPTVLLTRRSQRLHSHPGQVAFPGGRADPGDADIKATALREAWEEVGLPCAQVEVLGHLPAQLTSAGLWVLPVVAIVPPGLSLTASEQEVDEIFEVPLPFVLDPGNHRHHRSSFEGHERRWLSMPYQGEGREHFIWGVTASILRSLYQRMQAAQEQLAGRHL